MRWYTALPTAAVASGAAVTAYASLYERTRWTLRRFDVPVLAPGSAPLTILQISDLHMTAGQRSKQEWVAGLLARHLLRADGGEHHAERRRPQLVTGLHGGGQVGAELFLQWGHSSSLTRRPRVPGP